MGLVKEDTARERERVAWEMRTKQGASHMTIAAALGVEQPAVSKMLKRVGERIAKEMAAAVEAQKAEQTAQYDVIHEEAMAAWRRSQSDAEKTVTRTKELGPKRPTSIADEDGESLPFDPENVPGIYLDDEGEEVPEETRMAKVAAAAIEHSQQSDGHPLTVIERVTVEEAKGQVGDPRFLDAANKALDAKREIWGLNAPKPDGGTAPVVVKVYQGVNLEDEV